jgi:hypothetical protein
MTVGPAARPTSDRGAARPMIGGRSTEADTAVVSVDQLAITGPARRGSR